MSPPDPSIWAKKIPVTVQGQIKLVKRAASTTDPLQRAKELQHQLRQEARK